MTRPPASVLLSRRHALSLVAGATALGVGLRPGLAQGTIQVPDNDPRLITGFVRYIGPEGHVRAYAARTVEYRARPGIVLLNQPGVVSPFAQDFARRLALLGFYVLAPELAAGTEEPGDPPQLAPRGLAIAAEDVIAAAAFLRRRRDSTRLTGLFGVDWGGTVAAATLARASNIDSAILVSVSEPPWADLPVRIPVQLHYSEFDDRPRTERFRRFQANLATGNRLSNTYVYDGATVGFFDSTARNYHRAIADLVYRRSVEFLEATLKS
jgi:carboxymethylenebutenolidase